MSIEYKIVKKTKPGIKNSNEFSYCPVLLKASFVKVE